MGWIKRHKILSVILGLVLIGILAGAAGGDTATNDNGVDARESNETEQQEDDATVAAIGVPARDGKFEFTVNGVDCGKSSVGEDFLEEVAQGQFCLLDVSVKNIGDEPQSLFSDNQYLYNSEGQKYGADDPATIALSPNVDSWYSEINPGNTVEGVIVFDIPKDQTPVKAELHDSAFSGGVEVTLE